MSTKGMVISLSSILLASVLSLAGCASGDMQSKNDSMQQKTMMKDSGKQMSNDMDKHDDMGGSM